MNLFEKINKNILLIGLALLSYRVGNFAYSFIPKPYELVFVFLSLLTAVYVLFFAGFKKFFAAIPRDILIASGLLFGSIFLGWGVAAFINHVPTNLNMLLEFGTFVIGFVTFLFVLFYGSNDYIFSKKYYYALLVPVMFIPFVITPSFTPQFLLAVDGNFVGLTTNVNIISKILLVPAVYFIVNALMIRRGWKMRALYIFIAAALVSLVLWISSRGAILSLFLSAALAFLIVSSNMFAWKKTFACAAILGLIIGFGFVMTPYSRKQVVLNRILNSDATQFSQSEIKTMGLRSIVSRSVRNNTVQPNSQGVVLNTDEQETRLQIWPFYFKNVIARNPLGVGPNTHIESNVIDIDGNHVSTGPHNTFLELLLWGGVSALIGFAYILYRAFLNLKNKIKDNFEPLFVALFVTLFALSVTILFDDSLSFYYFWAVLALSLLPWKKSA